MEEEKNADSTNFTDFIYKISQLNYNITKSLFTKTKFEDINVEEKFQEFFFPKSRNYKIFCDIIIIIAFLSSFIYTKNWYTLITTIISLLISSSFICLSYTTKKSNSVNYLTICQFYFFPWTFSLKEFLSV